jgi:hypothetical protein
MMRMTIDFHDNELKQNAYLTDKFAEIIRAMGAHTLDKMYRKGPYDATDLPFRKRCPHFLILRAASYSSASTRKSLTERKFVVGAASKMSKLQMIESRLSNECLP